MNTISFDGCGLNGSDEFSSRLATCTEAGRSHGAEIARRYNIHTRLIDAVKIVLDGNSRLDPFAEKVLREAMQIPPAPARAKDENYFDTLTGALNVAVGRAIQKGYAFSDNELCAFLDQWNGGVGYGQTVRHACPVLGKGNRAMTVVLYRTEAGRYELTTYIN